MTTITEIVTMSDQESRDRIKADAEAAAAYDETTRTNTVTRALAAIAQQEFRIGAWHAIMELSSESVETMAEAVLGIQRCKRIIAAERAVLGEME